MNCWQDKGLVRWVLPVELGLDTLKDLQAQRPEGVETEVFALGRLPLAYSARCYTARSHNLPKDDCRFKCLDYPDGSLLKTREGQDFLVLNGIQTQSALTHQVLDQLPELKALGVDVLRISPQYNHTMEIIDIFDAARKGADTGTAGQTTTRVFYRSVHVTVTWLSRPVCIAVQRPSMGLNKLLDHHHRQVNRKAWPDLRQFIAALAIGRTVENGTPAGIPASADHRPVSPQPDQ